MADPDPSSKDITFTREFAETAKNGLRSKNATLQLRIMDFFYRMFDDKKMTADEVLKKIEKALDENNQT